VYTVIEIVNAVAVHQLSLAVGEKCYSILILQVANFCLLTELQGPVKLITEPPT